MSGPYVTTRVFRGPGTIRASGKMISVAPAAGKPSISTRKRALMNGSARSTLIAATRLRHPLDALVRELERFDEDVVPLGVEVGGVVFDRPRVGHDEPGLVRACLVLHDDRDGFTARGDLSVDNSLVPVQPIAGNGHPRLWERGASL